MPISIGKPVLLIDALYRLAEADRRVQVTIFAGLTLTRPRLRSSLERRFAGPLLDRLFADCREPLYAAALREDRLPPNIRINEFFLLAGASLANKRTQRSYISLNYSHVASYLESADMNVFAQLVASHPGGARVSLSAEPAQAAGKIGDVNDSRGSCPNPERPHSEPGPQGLQHWYQHDDHNVDCKEPDGNERDLRPIADQLWPHATGILAGDNHHPGNQQRQERPNKAAQPALEPNRVRPAVPPCGAPAPLA